MKQQSLMAFASICPNRLMQKELSKRASSTTEADFEDPYDMWSYVDYLGDQQVALDDIKKLGDELAILALHKQVEIVTNAIVDRYFPNAQKADRHRVSILTKIVPFIKNVVGYKDRDELRALANAIKHAGKVSKELAGFRGWGQRGRDLKNLGQAYERLRPAVQKHIQSFADECQKRGRKPASR